MTAFVEECRKEWQRLGVPQLLAEEMATDLEADLAEAQADGVSAAEVLGESDPRRFAETWASERGLVPEQPPRKSRKRLWIWVGIALVIFFVAGVAIPVVLATVTMGTSISQTHRVQVFPPQPAPSVRVPNFVGLTACRAKRIAVAAGLAVHTFPQRRCNAVVVAQRPAPGTIVPRRLPPQSTVTLRLRRAS
jgi:hypothetical protein